jgi:hypothetical protein
MHCLCVEGRSKGIGQNFFIWSKNKYPKKSKMGKMQQQQQQQQQQRAMKMTYLKYFINH